MKLSIKYSLLLLLLSSSMLIVGCSKKITFPIQLKFQGVDGSKEVAAIDFGMKSKVFKDGELDRESSSTVAFELNSEVLKVKPDGNVLNFQTTSKKDGFYELNRLGLPELGEEIQVEINRRGFILDVSGYPSDSLFYIPSIVFPDKPISPGDTWGESFKWRDYSVQFPLKTDVVYKLLGAEKYKKHNVLRIQVTASSKFENENKGIIFENHVEGFVLWDPKVSTVRFSETHMIDQLQVPSKGFKSITESDFVSDLIKPS